jgi:thiamine biosynthesis protein ThiS
MQIVLNGETKSVEAGLSVSGLLAALELEPVKIAVERNLEIVPRSMFDEEQLQDGDRIEIVQFVGGG